MNYTLKFHHMQNPSSKAFWAKVWYLFILNPLNFRVFCYKSGTRPKNGLKEQTFLFSFWGFFRKSPIWNGHIICRICHHTLAWLGLYDAYPKKANLFEPGRPSIWTVHVSTFRWRLVLLKCSKILKNMI